MNKVQQFLVNFTVFLLVFNAFHGFSWCFGEIISKLTGGYTMLITFLLTVSAFIYGYAKNKNNFDLSYLTCSAIILLSYLFTYFVCFLNGASVKIASLLNVCFLPLLILLNDSLKHLVFQRFLKFIIIFFTLSFIEYLVYLFFHTGITLSVYVRNADSEIFSNIQVLHELLFNFINVNVDIPRFQSLCEEPGQLGNVCWILIVLIGESRKYRKEQLLLFFFGAASFSLAFYVIAIIYFLSIKIRFKYVAVIIGLCAVFYFSFTEAFNRLVFERVDGKTTEEIDNRTSESFDYIFERSLRDGTIVWGHGGTKGDEIEGNNTGGKLILYEYGLVCTILIFLSCLNGYNSFSRKYGSVGLRKNLCFLLIFIGAFYKGGMIMSYYIMFLFIIYPLIYKINNVNSSITNENRIFST